MCLNILDKKQRKRGGVGYKILEEIGGSYCSGAIRGNPQVLSEDRFITDTNSNPIQIDLSMFYPAGFHIFPNMEELRKFIGLMGWQSYPVRRVRFKDVVASGLQGHYKPKVKVIVARRIKLLPKEANNG